MNINNFHMQCRYDVLIMKKLINKNMSFDEYLMRLDGEWIQVDMLDALFGCDTFKKFFETVENEVDLNTDFMIKFRTVAPLISKTIELNDPPNKN